MTNELVISIKKAATRGKTRNASGGGLCDLVTAVMLAMAVGVAPKQNHQIFGIITTFIIRRFSHLAAVHTLPCRNFERHGNCPKIRPDRNDQRS